MIETKTIIIPYTHATTNRVETKLTKICTEGWTLKSVKFWSFTFIKTKPNKRRYFIYSNPDKSNGISFDYYMAKKLYKNNQSKLKDNPCIFEVSNSKVDSKLYGYLKARNKYYTKFYISFAIAFLCLTILPICLSVWQLSFPFAIAAIYCLVSALILIYDNRKIYK